MEQKIKNLVEKETRRFVWDMQDFTKDQFEFIKERMFDLCVKAREIQPENLRDNPDGTCNCKPLMPGVCFFSEIDGSRCQCKCHFKVIEENEEEVCETCRGTGEVSTMERVYPNEPHMADVGTAPCPDCRPARDDDQSDE